MSATNEDLTSIQVRRALDGEEDALGWLVGHLDPLLRAQVRLRLGARDGPDVDDVVAEVWSVLLRRRGDIDPRGRRFAPTFVAFLSATAANLCNAALRRRIRTLSGIDGTGDDSDDDGLGPPIDPTRGVVTRVDGRDVRELVEAALERLDDDKRDVLVLRLLDQRTNAEVAEHLGIPPNTVAVRYRRALAELRERLPRGIYEGLRDLTFGSAHDTAGA